MATECQLDFKLLDTLQTILQELLGGLQSGSLEKIHIATAINKQLQILQVRQVGRDDTEWFIMVIPVSSNL